MGVNGLLFTRGTRWREIEYHLNREWLIYRLGALSAELNGEN